MRVSPLDFGGCAFGDAWGWRSAGQRRRDVVVEFLHACSQRISGVLDGRLDPSFAKFGFSDYEFCEVRALWMHWIVDVY